LLQLADFTSLSGLEECFKHHEDVFEGLETQHYQIKYYKEHFILTYILSLPLQEPSRVVLGERRVWQGCGAKRRCITEKDCLMYIPIMETIACLLKNDAVVSEVALILCV